MTTTAKTMKVGTAMKLSRKQEASFSQIQEFLRSEAASFGIPEEELTGNMLVMGKNAEQLSLAASAAGISLASLDRAPSAHFERLHVMVVAPEQLSALTSAASAVADTGVIMRPERYVYAMQNLQVPMDVPASLLQGSPSSAQDLLEYLRGYRDACNHLYEIVRNHASGGQSEAATVTAASGEWNLDVTGVLRSSATGKGIRIAILDTGIDENHHDFIGRTVASKSFIDGESVQDGHSHGTHCAGTASGPHIPGRPPRYGAAWESELLVAKVLSNSGRSAEQSVFDGLNWAIEQGAAIVSMSLGSRVLPGAPADPLFEDIAQLAMEEGCLIIAAAGNDSRRDLGLVKPVSHPANCPSIIAVGSIGRQMKISAFSNGSVNLNGGAVDLVAPGEDILSALPGAFGWYGRMSGSSMATPLVAGIAALYAQSDSKLRGRLLWDCLLRNCVAIQDSPNAVGAGLVQAPQ
jgi:subtilisin family serine protease